MKRWGWILTLIPYALLVTLVAGGAWLRFGHGDWDGGNQLHPDERSILFVAQAIEMPATVGDVLNPGRSPLNPFRTPEGTEQAYPYGHLPLYSTVIAQRLLTWVCPMLSQVCTSIPTGGLARRLLNVDGLSRFDHLTAVGRALSALFDTLTIVAVWLLAGELFGNECSERLRVGCGATATAGRPYKWAAIVAAGLCAFAVLHIQNAHFGTVDTGLALFATLCIWALVRYARTQQRRDSLLAGVFAGLALACKASAVMLVFPIGAAFLTRSGQGLPEQGLRQRLRLSTGREVWLTLLAALLPFALTNPYTLLDPGPFLRGVGAQAAITSGALDWAFTRQYIGTLPLLYPIEQQARWGLGLPLTLAAYGGLAWGARRAVKERSRVLAVAVIWAGAILIGGGVQQVKFPRYLLPLTPTLFALAGGMLTIPWAGDGQAHRAVGWLQGVCIVLVVAPSALYAITFEGMYRQPHPWVAASEWVYRELPAGSRIAVEQGDDALPLDIVLDGQLHLAYEHVETCTLDPFAEPDDEAKLRRTLRCVAGADFLFISSNRAYGVIPRLGGRYPLTVAYYRALFSGDLGYEVARSFRRPPTLLGWQLVDDPFARPVLANPLGGWGDRAINLGPADESLTVYDHPLVLVFGNEERLPVEQMRSRIGAELESRKVGMEDGAEGQ